MGIYLGSRLGTSLPDAAVDVVRKKISNPTVVSNVTVKKENAVALKRVEDVSRFFTSSNDSVFARAIEQLGIIPKTVPPPPPPPRINAAVPRLDTAFVELDPQRGAVDCFYVGLAFSLDAARASSARAVRVFRAEVTHPNFSRDPGVLSMHGVERISSIRASRRSRDARLDVERSLNDAGFFGALSSLNAKDGANRRPDADAAVATSGNKLMTPKQLGAETSNETFSLRGTLPL
jgi:hypothetical protein